MQRHPGTVAVGAGGEQLRSLPAYHRSADRALRVLGLFSESTPWLRVGEVAAAIGVSASTASRLLARLDAHGLVERHPRTGFYGVGPRVITLAGLGLNHSEMRRAGLEEMYRLVHTLGLGANLATLRAGAVFYLAHLDGRLAPRYYTLLGRQYPLHATALGKVLLAWREWAEVQAVVGADSGGALPRYTSATIGDLARLYRVLQEVRQSGYASEMEELAMGRACVAAPIRGSLGTVIAAISLSGPEHIMNLSEREPDLAAQAIDAAQRISERLGFSTAAHDVCGQDSSAAGHTLSG